MKERQSFTGARHLSLGEEPELPMSRRRTFLKRAGPLGLIALACAIAVGIVLQLTLSDRARSQSGTPAANAGNGKSGMAAQLPLPNLLRPLSPDDAKSANASRPLLERPDSAAASFTVTGDQVSRMRAVDCLTQAIYYEAASEGIDGGRAVAQIIINRMRHPSYPNSICAVVYEGSTRATGCQFTFTCDGSLNRVPLTYLWARSRKLASDALAGSVFAPVGHATHYHADYVLPYWADSLDKVAVIGRHIFYRFKGSAGSTAAFRQAYARLEPGQPLSPLANVIEESLQAVEATTTATPVPTLPKVEEDRVTTLTFGSAAGTGGNLPLQADIARGTLIMGEPGPVAHKAKTDAESACRVEEIQRIKAVNATAMKPTTSAC